MKKYPVRCPVTSYLHVMDGHWKPILVWYLKGEALRFGDLLEAAPDISTRVLTEQLKELEEDGIIIRKAYNETPPRVEYHLSRYGETLLPVLAVLRQWGLRHIKQNVHLLHPDSKWKRVGGKVKESALKGVTGKIKVGAKRK
jgi:DNA-binding HxlR family transcriptional regulator